jgi:hypothetical protein
MTARWLQLGSRAIQQRGPCIPSLARRFNGAFEPSELSELNDLQTLLRVAISKLACAERRMIGYTMQYIYRRHACLECVCLADIRIDINHLINLNLSRRYSHCCHACPHFNKEAGMLACRPGRQSEQ